VVSIPDGAHFPDIGGQVEVIPNHVCPVVNLHDELFVLEGDEVAVTWPIAARAKVR
jgi:D-serine deaminase-like pyridoxal phosphate-dependent protein